MGDNMMFKRNHCICGGSNKREEAAFTGKIIRKQINKWLNKQNNSNDRSRRVEHLA